MTKNRKQEGVAQIVVMTALAVMFVGTLTALNLSQQSQDNRDYARGREPSLKQTNQLGRSSGVRSDDNQAQNKTQQGELARGNNPAGNKSGEEALNRGSNPAGYKSGEEPVNSGSNPAGAKNGQEPVMKAENPAPAEIQLPKAANPVMKKTGRARGSRIDLNDCVEYGGREYCRVSE